MSFIRTMVLVTLLIVGVQLLVHDSPWASLFGGAMLGLFVGVLTTDD